MDCVQDPNLYDECKKIVKLWEYNFIKKKGRPPSKFDIREADKHVRHAYSMYFKLKTAALEQSLSDIFRDDDDNDNVPINTSTEINQEQVVVEEEIPIQQETHKNDAKPMVDDEVWGEHLNKKVNEPTETKTIERKIEKTNSALTQKLFKNSKFVKRNPRKSFQLNKSSSSLNSSQSLSQPINSSQYEEIENADISADISLSSFNSTLPIATDSRQISSQSVNIITQLLETGSSSMRHVDKGWLQRVSNNTGTKLLDSSNAPLNNEIFESIGNQIQPDTTQNEFDSDDIISDSDEEMYNSLHVSKRLKLSSTINNSTLSISSLERENKFNNTNIENASSNKSMNQINNSEISSSKIENLEVQSKIIEVSLNKSESVGTSQSSSIKESENNLNEIKNATYKDTETESDDEEIVQKKPSRKNTKKIISDEDSEYEESKPILKRKRNARKTTKSGSKETKMKTRTTKTTKSKKEKEKDDEEIAEKAEEYEMEYSVKPPPRTVPRINIKNILAESKIDVIENATSNAPVQTQEKLKKEIAKEKLLKKIESGSLNENFIRLDIKKKVYVRGKKHMNFTKFKKQMWRSKKKALYGPDMDMGGCDGGELTCFKCGKTGHFARQCKAQADADKLLPLNAVEEDDESALPSLEEASKMARESALAVRAPNQLLAELETTIKSLENPGPENNEPLENREHERKEADKATEETNEEDEEESKDSEYEFDEDDDLEEFMKNTNVDIEEKVKDGTTEMSKKWLELLEENDVKPLYELNEDGTLPGL